MLGDLAEAAVYTRDFALALRANDLLLGDPAPPEGEPNEGLRAFTAGAAAFASGEAEMAIQALEAAAVHFEAAGWRLFEGRALALLGHCSARGDRERAMDALERAAGLFGECQAVVRRQEVLAARRVWARGEGGRKRRSSVPPP